jgi:NADH-quinone oxidoreductase subunit N
VNGLIVISALGAVILLAGSFGMKKLLPYLTVGGLIAAFVVNLFDWHIAPEDAFYYRDMVWVDRFAVLFTEVIIGLTILVLLLSQHHMRGDPIHGTEFFSILVFTAAGAQVMVMYNNLIMLFIGIEILSISLYVLAGSYKKNVNSNEAALKYFLMGSFASAFLLMGIAFLYGATGSMQMQPIGAYMVGHVGDIPVMAVVGMLLLVVGLAFKVAAAPFHFWAPDVYQGSPTLVTAFMATVVKVAAIASVLRLFLLALAPASADWELILTAIAILTMSVGTATALVQKDFKRLLAYSGIAHAGFLLIGIVALDAASSGAILYYALGYSTATLTAFAILMIVSAKGDTSLSAWNGLAKRKPILAWTMTIALLSLAGIPPLAGFFGKYYLFALAIDHGHWFLAILAILNSIVGIYYYFYIIIAMFVKEPAGELELAPSRITGTLVLAVTTAGTIVIGLFPDLVLGLF